MCVPVYLIDGGTAGFFEHITHSALVTFKWCDSNQDHLQRCVCVCGVCACEREDGEAHSSLTAYTAQIMAIGDGICTYLHV